MDVTKILTGQGGSFHKAVRGEPFAPKRKHVRKMIVDTWNYGKIDIFKEMEKEPLNKNACVCFKSFTVLHKLLQEGAPRFLKRSHGALNLIRYLQNYWAAAGASDPHYGKLCAEYAYFLRGKITFHHKHPLVIGKLSLDDYKKKIQNQPEVSLQSRQQMVSHLLDLQEMILRIQDVIFTFHGRDLHEAKKAALVPLIIESDAVLRITVHHLNCLCERIVDVDQVQKYLNRFNQQYPRLRLFFDNTSRIPYVTDLVRVPVLPGDPPEFLPTGELAHLVPTAPDSVITISALMLDDEDQGNAPSPPPKPVSENAQFEGARDVGTQQAGSFQSGASESGSIGSAASQSSVPAKPAPAGWVSFGADAPASPAPANPAPAPAVPQTQVATTTAAPKAAPAGWMSFGDAPQQAVVAPVQTVESQTAVENNPPEDSTARTVSADELDDIHRRLSDLEALVKAKDDEAAYWKQMYEHSQQQLELANIGLRENTQRADDLEQHLQDLMEQQQREKEERLLRKLNASVSSVSSALSKLLDPTDPSNLSSTPEQVLEANKLLQAHLNEVEHSAVNRDHQALLIATKDLVTASNKQTEHSKGVSKLTDDPDLSALLFSSAQNAGDAIHKLLEAIREDPYDSDPIVANVATARAISEEVERATMKIIEAERVSDVQPGLVDKATEELMNAARVIEEAAKLLLDAKRQAEEQAKNSEKKYKMDVAGTIVGAAMAITDATGTLIKYATILQKENVEAGRTHGDGAMYKKDVTWSEGLISAAKSVAASVQQLVEKANGTVTEQVESEELVVASKQVAAATAQLLVASRVRSDPNSQAQKNLETASRAVTQATRTLVIASESEVQTAIVEEDTSSMLSGLSMTEVKIREMNQQAAILRLEKQLETERVRLAQMRKAQYQS